MSKKSIASKAPRAPRLSPKAKAELAAAAAAELAAAERAKSLAGFKTPELGFVRLAEGGKGGGTFAPVRAGSTVVRRKVYAYSNSGTAFVAFGGGFAKVVLAADGASFDLPLPAESPKATL